MAEPGSRGFSLRGKGGLAVAISVVIIFLVGLPAYRVFFGISILIGLAVAAILYLWHKHRPIREADVNNKKPLGL